MKFRVIGQRHSFKALGLDFEGLTTVAYQNEDDMDEFDCATPNMSWLFDNQFDRQVHLLDWTEYSRFVSDLSRVPFNPSHNQFLQQKRQSDVLPEYMLTRDPGIPLIIGLVNLTSLDSDSYNFVQQCLRFIVGASIVSIQSLQDLLVEPQQQLDPLMIPFGWDSLSKIQLSNPHFDYQSFIIKDGWGKAEQEETLVEAEDEQLFFERHKSDVVQPMIVKREQDVSDKLAQLRQRTTKH
ncbi:hypothetical protein EDD86DRAFT_243864 [Gorgonomyces haynaldii]|nr:hypothetical protein EDD86DRAFT_243864 [Gorgonomyces haynaldii]